MNITVNSWVESMEGYAPGEQINDPDVVKLNTNEASYPAAPAVCSAIRAETERGTFNKYPDPSCAELRAAIASRLDVGFDEIVCGNGSDENLRLLVHAFTQPGTDDVIAFSNPTYSLYSVLAEMFGARIENHASKESGGGLPDSLIKAPVKIVFLPNPNPPLGTFYQRAELERLAAADPDRLVVIDEAYVDFAPNDALSVYKKYENVVLTRTFSKSYSLAGLRAGFVICRPVLAASLNKIRDSYNVNRLTQVAALAAWNARDYYDGMIKKVLLDRAFLSSELQKRGYDVPDSQGNFVFARKTGAKHMYEALKQKKVLVRYFNLPGLEDGIRITVGSKEQLDRLLRAIDEVAQEG